MSSAFSPFGGLPAQRCLRCQDSLPFATVTCSNCGTYNPVVYPATFSDQRQVQWGGVNTIPPMVSNIQVYLWDSLQCLSLKF